MEAIGFALYDFNFVINPFEFAGVDSVMAMIKDAITVSLQHFGKRI